ncbi:MAG: phosphomannomutase/phosphoglucomutase [Deltaproteobacteria bacterium]|nr:phosphomannomutase/phosphoglucomutase [Deltaproteobacteria bacterium]
MNRGIFREYDIRGIVEKDLKDDDVYILSRAIGTYLSNNGAKRLSVGRDCRLSSDHISEIVIKGLCECGLNVVDIGIVPTPVFYFSLFELNTDGGVMITASHNPSEYNGFKVALGKSTIYGQEIQKLYHIATEGKFVTGSGSSTTSNVTQRYVDYVSNNIRLGDRRFKVAVDGGNGTGGPVATEILKKIGIEFEPLYCDMDGRFPNHHPDPTLTEAMQDLIKVVKEKGCEIGVGYDGDSDRLGVVDKNGNIVWGDQLMIIFAKEILKERPGSTFIAEVKCSKILYDEIRKAGGNPVMWRTGHSLIKAKMKELGAELAGEMSGHIFFANRYFGYDDAIYASMRLIELLTRSEKRFDEIIYEIPKMKSTPEIRVDMPDEKKFKIVEELKEYFKSQKYSVIDIDGVRVTFDDGWGLVRASNTQPALVLRFEAESENRLNEIKDMFIKKLAELKDRIE